MSCNIFLYSHVAYLQIYVFIAATTTSVATTTMEMTTTTECEKYKVPLDASNLVSPTKPLLTSDITALTEDNAEVVQIPSETFILKISGLDDEINGLKVSGENIGSITVTYTLPESPLAPVAVEVNEYYLHLEEDLRYNYLIKRLENNSAFVVRKFVSNSIHSRFLISI